MRKLSLLALVSCIFLSGCSNTEKYESEIKELKNKLIEKEKKIKELDNKLEVARPIIDEYMRNEKEKESNKNKIYSINDEWIVDGQWKLKVDGVTVTGDRNQFSSDKPSEVVVVKYSYENIGYDENLFITPSLVVDEQGIASKVYPARVSIHPQSVPNGVRSEGAEKAYGLTNSSNKIKIIFEKYDNNYNKQKATFEVNITK